MTDEMLDAACVLHISDISPSELFIQHLDTSLKMELAKSLLRGPSTIDPGENIFILSAQSSSPFGRREKRSVPTGGSGVGVDLLMAVYDPVERQFIESGQLVQRIHALQTNLSKLVGHQIHAYNSLCALKVSIYLIRIAKCSFLATFYVYLGPVLISGKSRFRP